MIDPQHDQDGITVSGRKSDTEIVGMHLTLDDIDQAISEIKDWFQEGWGQASGLPAFVVGEDGQPVGGMDLLTDLADYLPQLYLAEARDYVREQVDLAVKAFQRKHVIMTPRERRGFLGFWRRSNPFYSTDFLLGLVILHRLDSGLVPLDRLRDITRNILTTYLRNGWMVKEVVYPFRWRVPLSESDSLLYVEILAELLRLSGDREFLDAAQGIAQHWLDHLFTRTCGVAPQLAVLSPIWKGVSRFAHREVTAILYKHNTALLAGLMALSQLADDKDMWKQAAFRVADSVSHHFIDDKGRVYFQWESKGSETRTFGVSLGNSVVIEPLLDMYHLFGRDQDLVRAKLVAGYWMALQDPVTGLVPNDSDNLTSEMDHQTDFAVNLHRLYSMTGDRQYLDAAVRIVNGQLRYHRKSHGYVNRVHAKTGAVIDGRVETRYTSLFLKVFHLLKQGKSAWDDPNVRWVMKDR